MISTCNKIKIMLILCSYSFHQTAVMEYLVFEYHLLSTAWYSGIPRRKCTKDNFIEIDMKITLLRQII